MDWAGHAPTVGEIKQLQGVTCGGCIGSMKDHKENQEMKKTHVTNAARFTGLPVKTLTVHLKKKRNKICLPDIPVLELFQLGRLMVESFALPGVKSQNV
jgi:hypothetical protein